MHSNNLKLLMVDDEKDTCEYTSSHLKRKGYNTFAAFSPDAALALIKEQNPDIMLLDMNLPGMSGVDLLKLIRQFNTTIKVVIISGYPIDRNDPQFKGLNILEFIQKPVPFSILDSVLEKITGKEKDDH